MADLTAAMGITKPSLYSAFGNKEALFNKALDLYEREKLAYMTSALSAPTARAVAERLLRGALEIQTSTCNPKGCLGVIAASACGAEAESIKAHVLARRASSEAAVVQRFEVAKNAGELPDDLEPEALDRYLFAVMQGLGEGLKPPCGTIDMLSTPPAINASPEPIAIWPAIAWMAYIDEPQKRLIVAPPTSIDSPASSEAMRAMLLPCAPSAYAHPMITSSIRLGSIPVRSTRAFNAMAARSSGLKSFNAPFRANVNGVRT